MKKALSTAILATMLVISSAWADTSDTSSTTQKTHKEMRQEHREMRREMKGEIKDYRKEHRADIKQAKAECKVRLEAATTDAEKEAIHAECKAEAKAAREALRENIKALREERFTLVLANLKAKIEANLEAIKALPADEKAEWKEKVLERLDNLEDKANESNKDNLVLTIAAIRVIVAGI